MRVVEAPISIDEIKKMAGEQFGDMVKAVVDVRREVMALGGELHADEEALLLGAGSEQADLWGINLYPELAVEDWLEFDSMINIRPSQNNRTRGVDSEPLRRRIEEIVSKLVIR